MALWPHENEGNFQGEGRTAMVTWKACFGKGGLEGKAACQESLDSSGVLFRLQRITQVHRVHGMLRSLWMGVQDLIRDETHGFS